MLLVQLYWSITRVVFALIPNRNAEQNVIKHMRHLIFFSSGTDSGTRLKFRLFICLAQSESLSDVQSIFEKVCDVAER